MTHEDCLGLIEGVYQEFVPPGQPVGKITPETRLFGGDSPLDSTALVSLLIEVEQQVNEACNTQIVVADDRAMSQKRSPFRTVGSLADYIQTLLKDHSKV